MTIRLALTALALGILLVPASFAADAPELPAPAVEQAACGADAVETLPAALGAELEFLGGPFPPFPTPCGENTCAPGQWCCNPSCGTCANPGDYCLDVICPPVS